jgi:hypothetical protein
MKYHTLSIVILIIGIIFAFGNFWRYFIMYPDNSELIRGILEGLFICGFGYVLNWMRNKDDQDEEQNKKFEGLNKIIFKEEFK